MGSWLPLESPLSPSRSTVLPFPPSRKPFLHEIPARTPVRAGKGGPNPVFERDTLSSAPPPTIPPARCRPRSAQRENQRSKHVSTVDLPDSVGEDGIGSLMAEEAIDGVGG